MPTDDDMRAAFLASIIETPGDDFPRLVFADWLEDHGEEERAEIIRVQCEYTSLSAVDRLCPHMPMTPTSVVARWKEGICQCRGCVLVRREAAILGANTSADSHTIYPRWHRWCHEASIPTHFMRVPGFNDDTPPYSFRRGFVAEVHCPLAAWLEHGPAIVRGQPVEVVRLMDREPQNDREMRKFRWYGTDGIHPESRYIIGPLWIFLPGSTGKLRKFNSGYDSPEEAHADLSRACLAWARLQPVRGVGA